VIPVQLISFWKMGRRGKNRGSRGPRRGVNFVNMGGQIVKIPFRVTFNLVSMAAGFNSNAIGIHPTYLGDVASHVAPNFTWYRVVKLRIRFVPGTRGVNSEAYQFAAAYNSVPTTDLSTGPAGMSNMAQFPSFEITNGEPVNIIVPRRQLLGVANKWFRVSDDNSPPPDEYFQGSVTIASQYSVLATANLTHICLVEGELQLRSIIEVGDLMRKTSRLVHVPAKCDDSKSDDDDVSSAVEIRLSESDPIRPYDDPPT